MLLLLNCSNKVRSDRRCGAEFPLDDGKASECDGEGPNYCCSKFGYCGPGAAHCDGGVDYRPASALKGNFKVIYSLSLEKNVRRKILHSPRK